MEQQSTNVLRFSNPPHDAPPSWRRWIWAYVGVAVVTLLVGAIIGVTHAAPAQPLPNPPGVSSLSTSSHASTPTPLTAASTATAVPAAIPTLPATAADIAAQPITTTSPSSSTATRLPVLAPTLSPATNIPPTVSLRPAHPVMTTAPQVIQPLVPVPAQGARHDTQDNKPDQGNAERGNSGGKGNGKEKG